jgi:hypothetical protein
MNYNSVNVNEACDKATKIPFIDDDENTNWPANDDVEFYNNLSSDDDDCGKNHRSLSATDPAQMQNQIGQQKQNYTALQMALDSIQCVLFYFQMIVTFVVAHVYLSHKVDLHSFAMTVLIATSGLILRIFTSTMLKFALYVDLMRKPNTGRGLKFGTHLLISALNMDVVFW